MRVDETKNEYGFIINLKIGHADRVIPSDTLSILMKSIVVEVIAFLCIALFVYAAAAKLFEYPLFVVQLSQSPMLTKFASDIAWVVPSVEIVIAIALAIPRLRLIGFYGFYTLMVVFVFYIIAITQYSHFVPCSCGGVLSKLGWTEHLFFNLFFVLLSMVAILLLKSKNYDQANPIEIRSGDAEKLQTE
jgi:hypothetical protein